MKLWMKSLMVPAAIAGGMLGSTAFADDAKAVDNAAEIHAAQVQSATAQEASQVQLNADIHSAGFAYQAPRASSSTSKAAGPYSGLASILNANHLKNGSIARSTNSEDGTAAPKERVSAERVHIQTQFQQAAMGGDAASDRMSEDDANDTSNNGKGGKTSKASKPVAVAHPTAGDSPAESDRGLASEAGKMGRAGKDGERPHFSAAQKEEMGSSKPAVDDSGSGTAQKAGRGVANTKGVASSGEKPHLAPQVMQEMSPEGASAGSHVAESSHSPSFNATETRVAREMPAGRGSMETSHAQVDRIRLPSSFYR